MFSLIWIHFLNPILFISSQEILTYNMQMGVSPELAVYTNNTIIYFEINIISIKNKSATYLFFYLYPKNNYNYIKAYLSLSKKYPTFNESDYRIVSEKKPTFYLSKKEFENIDKFYITVECKENCNFNYSGHGMEQLNLIKKTKFDKYINKGESLNARYNFGSDEKYILFTALSPDSNSICFTANIDNIEYKPKKILPNSYGLILSNSKSHFADFIFKNCIENKGNYASIATLPIDYESINNVDVFEQVITVINATINKTTLYKFTPIKKGRYSMRIETLSLNLFVQIYEYDNKKTILIKKIKQIGYLNFEGEENKRYDIKFFIEDENSNAIGIRYQISFENELYDFQFKNMEIFRNIPTRDILSKGYINYYRVISRGDDLSTPLEYHLHMIKGYPILYYVKCTTYPNCKYNKNDLKNLIEQGKAISNIDVNDNIYIYITPEQGDFYHTSTQYLALVYCDENKNEDCEYQIEIDNINGNGINYILLDNVMTYDSLKQNESDIFNFEVIDNKVSIVHIVTYSYTGHVDIIPKYYGNAFSAPHHVSNGNREVWVFIRKSGIEIEGYFSLNMIGKENTFFSLLYYTDKEEINDVKSGEEVLKTLKGQEEIKIFRFYNRNNKDKVPYIIDINSLNCELMAKLNNRVITKIPKYHQFLIKPDDDDYNNDNYNITVSVYSYIKVKPKNYDYCLFQISGIEVHEERELLLNEGYSHIENFNNVIKNLTYLYPYYLLKNGGKEQLYFSLSKNDNAKYVFTYQINQGSIKEIDFTSDKKLIKFSPTDLLTECKNILICPIKIIVTLKSECQDDKNTELEIKFLSSHNIPTYMKHDIVKCDSVITDSKNFLSNSKYNYFFQDLVTLDENTFQYIFINFKRGHGSAVAKIIPKNIIEPNSNWNQRINLPIKNPNNLTYYIPYDVDNSMFKISKNETQDCSDYNCELYIGIYSTDIDDYIKLNEFSIHAGNYTALKENELLYFYIEKVHSEQRTTFIIDKDSDVVYINFNSDMCRMTIVTTKDAKAKFWKIDSSIKLFAIYANDTQLKLNSLKGLVFSLRIKSENLYTGQCKFSVKYYIPEKYYPEVFTGNYNEASIGKFRNNELCYFIIPCLMINNFTNITIYANNDYNDFSTDIEIYVNKMDYDDYYKLNAEGIKNSMPTKSKKQFSSENQFNSDYLNLNNIGEEFKDIMLLITIQYKNKIESNSLISLISLFDNTGQISSIENKNFELIKIRKNEEITIDLGKMNQKYYFEIGLIDGKIELENSKYKIEKFNLTNDKIYGLFINPSKDEHYILRNKNNNYSFVYARYTINEFKNNININEIFYNKKNLILYHNKYNKIKWPISFYLPIDNQIISKEYDIQITIKIYMEKNINQANYNFTLIGGMVDLDFINKLKYSNNTINQPNISSKNIFNDGLKEAQFIFNYSIIKNNFKEKDFFFVSIDNNYNLSENFKIVSKVLPINIKSDSLIIPNSDYYFSNFNMSSNMTILKLKKNNFEEKTMQIEFSCNFDNNIIITINPEDKNVDYFKNNSDLIQKETIKYGKSYIDLNLEKFSNKKYIEFALIPKNTYTQNKIKRETRINNYVIKYQTERKSTFILPDEYIHYSIENGTFFVSKVMKEKIIVSNAIYIMYIYLEKEINDINKINTIYPFEIPKYTFSPFNFSQNEIIFKVNNSILKNQNLFISIIVTATFDEVQEILQYRILKIKNEEPINNNTKKWLIFIIIVVIIAYIILYVLFKKKTKINNSLSGDLIDTNRNINLIDSENLDIN